MSASDASQQLPEVLASEESEDISSDHRSKSAPETQPPKKKKRRSLCPSNLRHNRQHALAFYERQASQAAFVAQFFQNWEDRT